MHRRWSHRVSRRTVGDIVRVPSGVYGGIAGACAIVSGPQWTRGGGRGCLLSRSPSYATPDSATRARFPYTAYR